MRSVLKGQLVRRGFELPPAPVCRELALPPNDNVLYFLRAQSNFAGRCAAVKRYIQSQNSRRDTISNLIGDFRHGWVESIPAEARFAGLLHVEIGVPLLSIWWSEAIRGSPTICSHMIFAAIKSRLASTDHFEPAAMCSGNRQHIDRDHSYVAQSCFSDKAA